MKNYFIGIDVSKEKIDVSVIKRNSIDDNTRLGHEEFENSNKGFLRMLQWTKRLTGEKMTSEKALFCCETTGAYDLKLCDYLHNKEQFIWRESALQIKRSLGFRRGKDDVSDAWAIADYALRHADKATCYNPLLPEVMELKTLVNHREGIVRRLRAAKVSIGEISATALAKKSDALKFVIRDCKKEIADLEKRLEKCEQEIQTLINEHEDLKKTYEHVKSIPGIGLVNASALIAYTNNFMNFKTASALATYMGLVAFREQSGTSINRAVRTNCYSNRQLKTYISQAALAAIRFNHTLKAYYERMIAAGKQKGVALNNVKNKLVRILFSLVEHDCDFEYNHETTLALHTITAKNENS